ncbi:MAG: alkyl hydroperoxide reductase subunit C [Lachnospirales bacterium]
MALIGKKLDAFELDAYKNEKFIKVSNKDLLGKWSVLFFYPADFTFVCPTELQDVADIYEDFQKIGCEIYSVSNDTHFVHKAWSDASDTIKKIKYPMIGDPTAKLSKQLDVLIEEEGLTYRGTFILNPEGSIVAYEVHDNGIGRNAEELLRKVQAAQFVYEHGDQVCPAKWKPGEKTLSPGIDLVGKI